MTAPIDAPQVDAFTSPTRPQTAPARQSRSQADRKIKRFTLDLEADLHRTMNMFCLNNNIKAARMMRAFLTVLDSDEDVQQKILAQVFAEDEED